LLDKQVILEETVSQLQNNNANLKAKIDLIDMRLEDKGSTDHIRKLNNRITRDLVNNDIFE
jgi:hypothetical protein